MDRVKLGLKQQQQQKLTNSEQKIGMLITQPSQQYNTKQKKTKSLCTLTSRG